MSQNYEKLKTPLQELFQLDQPDLDFGIYRVMHAKSAEVSQILGKDLVPLVQTTFVLSCPQKRQRITLRHESV
jgi:adenine-specific DNA-methyltransferase